jgi:hypothetical protein
MVVGAVEAPLPNTDLARMGEFAQDPGRLSSGVLRSRRIERALELPK